MPVITKQNTAEGLEYYAKDQTTGTSISHSGLLDLDHDDHPQYRLTGTTIGHSSLSGLTEDDHPQYLRVDQSSAQTFTGGTVTGTGLLNVTGGELGLDTTAYATALLTVTSTAIDYDALSTDSYIRATAVGITITLPTAVGITGKVYITKNASTGAVYVTGAGGETIEGVIILTISSGDSYDIISNGTNWEIK